MSFNPDDTTSEDKDATISSLREENEDLKRQMDELLSRLSLYEDNNGAAIGTASRSRVALGLPSSVRGNAGRKSIPFATRTPKQHQGRMAYLLKKLEMQDTWSQDAIADLQEYCISQDIIGAGSEFFRTAIVAFAGESAIETITDIDTFLAMIQH